MPFTKNHQLSDAISPAALALTSDLLRHNNPSLASAVQGALSSITGRSPAQGDGSSSVPSVNEPLNATLVSSLEAQTIGRILAALTELGTKAMGEREQNPEQLELLNYLLQDWSNLAEWLLHCADSPEEPFH